MPPGPSPVARVARAIGSRDVARPAAGGWQVYVLECADRTLYTGIARDLDARVAAHNDGRGARYTRGRRPVRLVYAEPASDRGTALRREHAIKRLPAAAKRALVKSAGRRRATPL